MRKLVFSLVVLGASTALAQGKVAVKWDCGAPSPAHSLAAGEQADHVFMIAQVKCKAVEGQIEGIKQGQGAGTEFHEVSGTADSFKGVFVETLSNGDKIHYTYKGTAVMKDGSLVSAKNTWSSTRGTGAFKGFKGSGSCTVAPKPDGGATFECAGDYTISK